MPKSSFKDIISSDKPVLIDFYADWCGPCKMLSPLIIQLKQDYGSQIRVIKIDTEKNQKLSKDLDIMSIPAVHIYLKGNLEWQASGVQTKTVYKNAIDNALEKL